MQGWRNSMEDAHIVELDLGGGVAFFGVYDGHGGTYLFLFNLNNSLNDRQWSGRLCKRTFNTRSKEFTEF